MSEINFKKDEIAELINKSICKGVSSAIQEMSINESKLGHLQEGINLNYRNIFEQSRISIDNEKKIASIVVNIEKLLDGLQKSNINFADLPCDIQRLQIDRMEKDLNDLKEKCVTTKAIEEKEKLQEEKEKNIASELKNIKTWAAKLICGTGVIFSSIILGIVSKFFAN